MSKKLKGGRLERRIELNRQRHEEEVSRFIREREHMKAENKRLREAAETVLRMTSVGLNGEKFDPSATISFDAFHDLRRAARGDKS